MDTIAEVANLKPFNEIFYKNCYNMAFFQVILSYKRSILPVLLSEIEIYSYQKGRSGLYIQQIPIKTEETILEEIGIYKEGKERSDNLLQDVVKSIGNNKPVIICIDRFYETIVPYFYQTIHSHHKILIYGYDKNEEHFKIIEDRNGSDPCYEPTTIKYNDLITCYNGFLTNFQTQPGIDSYIEYTVSSSGVDFNIKANKDRHIKVYIDHMLEKEEMIFNALNNILLFLEDLKQVIYNESFLRESAVNLRDMCWWIIQSKVSQSFVNKNIFGQDFVYNEIIEEIIKSWRLMFQLLARFILTLEYDVESINKALEKIEDTFRLENEYHQGFFKFLHQWSYGNNA